MFYTFLIKPSMLCLEYPSCINTLTKQNNIYFLSPVFNAILKFERVVESVSYNLSQHYNDVIMGAIASLITSLTIVYSTVYSDADQRKHQSSASPVNSPHKWPVTRKMFPFDDVIMLSTKQASILSANSDIIFARKITTMVYIYDGLFACGVIQQIVVSVFTPMMMSWHGNAFCIIAVDLRCQGAHVTPL